MPRTLLAVALLALLAPAAAAPRADSTGPLTTESERSGFVRTGRYSEVIALCDAFAKTYPDAVRCIEFGTTPEGRPMKALVVSRSAHGAPLRVARPVAACGASRFSGVSARTMRVPARAARRYFQTSSINVAVASF